MATISNTPRPGYVYDSTDGVWYPIGTGSHNHSEIPSTIVDAKGDIITASAADTPARLAVGNNGETLVADSSTSTGLRYQGNFAAGKNKIINGDFGVWQRGTSFSPTPGVETYTADRWVAYVDGTTTSTFSRQTFTPGTAPVAGYEGSYFYRALITSQTGGSGSYIYQKIEDVRTFAGQTVTMSFWAKAAATGSSSIYLTQNFGSGGSATINGTNSTISLTTSWQRFTYTVAVPSISGKTIGTSSFLAFYIQLTANLAQTVDIWGVQVEAGSVATAFQTATGTIQGELAACQRYFISYGGLRTYEQICVGSSQSTTIHYFWLSLPVEMRVNPTIGYSSLSHWNVALVGTGSQVYTGLSEYYSGAKTVCWSATTSALTNAGGNKAVSTESANTTSARLTFSAEL